MSSKTPVLFLVFNRPAETELVFESIRRYAPTHLYIAADGPRPGNTIDEINCKKVKEIIGSINWPCEVHTLFREKNLGCKLAVSDAISWFFNHVEEGIILEDDVLPQPNFFPFCEAMLQKYRDDSRVWMITGLNINGEWKSKSQDYFFSRYGGIWGWATWRRAWKFYDKDIKDWSNEEIKRLLLNTFPDGIRKNRINMYNELYNNRIDTWDYQWTFCKLLQSGLNIIPALNLIKNIGFTKDGTHTTSDNHPWANLPAYSFKSIYNINPFVIADTEYEMIHHELHKSRKPLLKRIFSK
jgi:hypothetical protein